MLAYHVRGTGIKTQLSLFSLLLVMLETFFLSSENEAKNHFFQKQSGDIGLMIQMFNLIFFAAAVSNY